MEKRFAIRPGILRPRLFASLAFWIAGLFLAIATLASRSVDPAVTATNSPGWSIVPSPNVNPDHGNVLRGVACISSVDCWAVGDYLVATDLNQTLIEHWDGNSWTIVSSPNTSAALRNYLLGVTCNSASDCWAVGIHIIVPGSKTQTLVEHWDGSSWAIVPSPNATATGSAADNSLTSVTCTSSTDCWAVGAYRGAFPTDYQTLILHWNGSSWTIVPSPNRNALRNFLNSVTCVSSTDCWAAGISSEFNVALGSNVPQTLAEHWNGVGWTVVSSPNINPVGSFRDNVFAGIECTSTSDCWAVGSYDNTNYSQTLIERWNGTSWTIVTSPNAITNNTLSAVACASASDCWTAGFHALTTAVVQTLSEHWDGTSWAVVNSPNTSANEDNHFFGVSCASSSACWGVGLHGTEGALDLDRTLVEEYALTVPALNRVASRLTQGAGTFDVDLPLAGPPGIECRSGGPANDYQIVFSFASLVTFNSAAVAANAGTVSGSSGSGTTTITVNLTGVTNAQTITVTLLGVSNGTSTGDIAVQMGVLFGDVTGNGVVNASDVSQTQSESGHALSDLNFRADVTANGGINSTDVSTVQGQSGTGLSGKAPPLPKSFR